MKPLISGYARAPGPARAATSCTRTASGAVVCRLTGDIDTDSAPAATQALLTALDHRQPPELYVDLAGVQYFSAAGLTVLLTLREAAAATSVPLTLVAPSRVVSRVLELTGTRDLFTVMPGLQPSPDGV